LQYSHGAKQRRKLLADMHFYDFNIGDYAKKTQHLTNDEDLAYRRLLDMYYDSEKPITHGLATLSRRLRIDEKSIKNVIDEFFPNGINKHADEKIVDYHAYLLKQSENGKKGGRPKNQGVTTPIDDNIKPTDNPPLSQNNPVPSQPLTTKPLTTNQDLKPFAQTEKKPSVHAIQFSFESGEFTNINGHLSVWEKAYPAVNIQGELNKAAAWLIANPKNRKSNYAKFLTGWLSRTQDKAPAQGGGKKELSTAEFMKRIGA